MIPLLVVEKRVSGKAAAALTPERIVAALADHGVAWTAGKARFAGAIASATATKSLRAVARDYPPLQSQFRMVPAQALGRLVPDEEKLDFAAALACRDKELLVTVETHVVLDPASPTLQSTLAMLAEVLTTRPSKSYKYAFEIALTGADFGPHALRSLPPPYVDGRDRFEATLSPLLRMALGEYRDSVVKVVLGGNGNMVLGRCLLHEVADAQALRRAPIPDAFASLFTSLGAFKASAVKRQPIMPVAALEQHAAATQAALAQRAGVASADVQALAGGNYAALTVDERLSIELALHEHVLGVPYTESTLAADASTTRKEWLLVKVGSALIPGRLGPDWNHVRLTHLRRRAAAAMEKREFTTFAALLEATPAADRIASYRASVEQRLQQAVKDASAHMRRLAEERSLPHSLDDAPQGRGAPAEKFDRRKILDRVFRPLGYERVPQPVGSVGLFEYAKDLADGQVIRLMFDFGSWRKTVVGTFSFVAGQIPGLTGTRFNVRYVYWPRDGDIAITSEDLFARTFDNIGALTAMLEREHVPRFRQLLDEARLT